MSRHTDLALEDMGILKDTMDKEANSLLKKARHSTLSKLKLAMDTMECLLGQIKEHV